jgi:integrase
MVAAEQTWRSRLAAGAVLKHHRLLREALEQAVRWQTLAVNPANAVTPPRQSRREMCALNTDQSRALLDAVAGTEFDCELSMLLYAGLRLGELLGLRWADVDLEVGQLHVQQTLQRMTGGEVRMAPTKTHRSRRMVDLPGSAVAVLREHRRLQAEARLLAGNAWEDAGLVFTDRLGRPIRLRLAFWRLLDEAGLPRIRLHDLRHTMATLMLAAGEHPKVVSERLGHATVNITLDTYSHVLPGLGRAAAERLGQSLTRGH